MTSDAEPPVDSEPHNPGGSTPTPPPPPAGAAPGAANTASPRPGAIGVAEAPRRLPPQGPRRLTRSSDRRIAGVAGGVADYLGIDPVIVRLGFVLALFAGGAGAIAYLAGWVLLPERSGGPTGPSRGTPVVDSSIALAGLLLVAAVVLGLASPIDGGVLVPLALIGAGVWLLSQRGSSEAAPTFRDTMLQSEGDAPVRQTWQDAEPGPSVWQTGSPMTPTERIDLDPPIDPANRVHDDTWYAPDQPVEEPRPPAIVTRVTLSLVTLFVAGAIAADASGLLDVSPTVVAASCLVGIGLGTLVAAFVGHGRGLIPLGILTAATLGVLAAAEPAIEAGVGERTHRPLSVADVSDRYELGIGELVVDLRELDIADGETVDVTLDLGIGEARLIVPDGVDLEITGDVRLGNLDLFGREENGFGNELDADHDAAGTGRIVAHIEVGIGDGRATR